MRLIVSDGVFSMDGNVTPLPEIVDLARRYNALVFLDECHATGFFGATGRWVHWGGGHWWGETRGGGDARECCVEWRYFDESMAYWGKVYG